MMDPWRIKRIWPIYFKGLVFSRARESRLQWWIFWRRVAAGLGSGQQAQIFSSMSGVLLPGQAKRHRRTRTRQIKVSQEERREMWLFAANLERLEISSKIELGRELLSMLIKTRSAWQGSLWVLSRIGSRQPLYGPANKVVPPKEVYSWLKALKRQEWRQPIRLFESVISMARLTGDRIRDLQPTARQDIINWLQLLGAKEGDLEPLRDVVSFAKRERDQAFGESLPEGLILEQETVTNEYLEKTQTDESPDLGSPVKQRKFS